MGDECEECLQATPMMHWHYEEMDDSFYEPEPEPAPRKISWDDLLEQVKAEHVSTRVDAGQAKTRIVRTPPTSVKHEDPALTDGVWVCKACGSESADLVLFEEVGAEVNCKSTDEVAGGLEDQEVQVTNPAASRETDWIKKMLDDAKTGKFGGPAARKTMIHKEPLMTEPVTMHIDKPKPGEVARQQWLKQYEAQIVRERRKAKF